MVRLIAFLLAFTVYPLVEQACGADKASNSKSKEDCKEVCKKKFNVCMIPLNTMEKSMVSVEWVRKYASPEFGLKNEYRKQELGNTAWSVGVFEGKIKVQSTDDPEKIIYLEKDTLEKKCKGDLRQCIKDCDDSNDRK